MATTSASTAIAAVEPVFTAPPCSRTCLAFKSVRGAEHRRKLVYRKLLTCELLDALFREWTTRGYSSGRARNGHARHIRPRVATPAFKADTAGGCLSWSWPLARPC
jgi:hypothetical protein